jgi:glycosyltransferase involved in cell wall biosynthesis
MLQQSRMLHPQPIKVRSIVFLGTAHDNGGSSILASNLAEAMRAAGHHVEEWYLFGSPGLALAPGTRIFRHGPRSARALATLIPTVIHALRRHRADVVIGLQSLSNLVAGIGGALACVPHRIATHHNPVRELDPRLMMFDRVAGRAGAYTKIVACAASVGEGYAANGEAYARHMAVIPNGQKKPIPVRPADARRSLQLPEGIPIIGQIGRFCAQKNQAYTLELLARLPEAFALFIGTGPDAASIETALTQRGLAHRARIVSSLAPSEIGRFFAACDAVVFPSRFEGLSLAAIEAVHCGTPLLCSDIPSFREMFASSPVLTKAALLPLDEQDAWVAALTRLFNDAAHREAMRAALAALSPSYSFEAMAARYLALVGADAA